MEEDKAEARKGLQWENCKQALRRVKANKGSPGVVGMTVHGLMESGALHQVAHPQYLVFPSKRP